MPSTALAPRLPLSHSLGRRPEVPRPAGDGGNRDMGHADVIVLHDGLRSTCAPGHRGPDG